MATHYGVSKTKHLDTLLKAATTNAQSRYFWCVECHPAVEEKGGTSLPLEPPLVFVWGTAHVAGPPSSADACEPVAVLVWGAVGAYDCYYGHRSTS
jgi:hypothetical protein